MLGELALRFLIGGAMVSLFAMIGEVARPRTFSGLFGAAPSVAIATLAITIAKHGTTYAASEAGAMIVGALALVAYSLATLVLLRYEKVPAWLAAGALWALWLAAAFALRAVSIRGAG